MVPRWLRPTPNRGSASTTRINGRAGRHLNLHRYSALKDINTANVKGLQMIWSQSSGTLRGMRGSLW